jgi:hypothetical protein
MRDKGPAWTGQIIVLAAAVMAALANVFNLVRTQGAQAALWTLAATALFCLWMLRSFRRVDERLSAEGNATGGFGSVGTLRLGRLEQLSPIVGSRLEGAKLRRSWMMAYQLDGGMLATSHGIAWEPGWLSRNIVRCPPFEIPWADIAEYRTESWPGIFGPFLLVLELVDGSAVSIIARRRAELEDAFQRISRS